ncbi:hypothetical protein HYY69_01350 [Candidatus Woesearchaeota archaeon]|nr:hypothetical protein [Candidatus Woesearchaeota archaeon]
MYDPKKDEDVNFDMSSLLKFGWKKFQGPVIIFIAAVFILIYGLSLLWGGNDDNSNKEQLVNEAQKGNSPQKTAQFPDQGKKSTTTTSSSEPASAPSCQPGCLDTDNGINTNSVGHTYFGTNTTCITKYDRCINYTQLEEFYCEQGMMQSKIVTCKNGCTLGECMPMTYN